MRIKLLPVVGAMACMVLVSSGHAALANGDMKDGHHPHHMMMMHHDPFEMLDVNHDGSISKKEVLAHFNMMDANHDGKISKEEWESHMKKMHGGHDMKHDGWMHCEGSKEADYSNLNK